MTSGRSIVAKLFIFIAIFLSTLTVGAGSLYAKGNIHIILIVSTTDPATKTSHLIWKERIEDALSGNFYEGKYSFLQPNSLYRADRIGGLGKGDVATYIVLEEDEARPEKIREVCKGVAAKAGADDAIAVFMVSHGGTVRGDDGVVRHALSPVARSSKDIRMDKIGIKRGSIIKWLNEESYHHRLVVLVTDSCATPFNFPTDVAAVQSQSTFIPEFLPKRDCYLKRFLEEAEGVVNINTTNYGEESRNPTFRDDKENCANDRRVGTRFSYAFLKFATNGIYLESELNPEGFYRLLSLELSQEISNFKVISPEMQCKQTLTSFKEDSQRIIPQEITDEQRDEIIQRRRELISKSGEFPKNVDRKQFTRVIISYVRRNSDPTATPSSF